MDSKTEQTKKTLHSSCPPPQPPPHLETGVLQAVDNCKDRAVLFELGQKGRVALAQAANVLPVAGEHVQQKGGVQHGADEAGSQKRVVHRLAWTREKVRDEGWQTKGEKAALCPGKQVERVAYGCNDDVCLARQADVERYFQPRDELQQTLCTARRKLEGRWKEKGGPAKKGTSP